MSDNIPPFEIQTEIIKKVCGVRSLVRFRSVSKAWKYFIDRSDFIKGYDARNTHPHTHILSGLSKVTGSRFICLVEEEDQTIIKVQQQQHVAPFVFSTLVKQFPDYHVVGASHGLVCMLGFHVAHKEWMLVIWNPSIGKSFGIVQPSDHSYTYNYGFGVCPVTKYPTVVKFIIQQHNKPWHAQVFTLSSRVWNVIPSSNLPPDSVQIIHHNAPAVTDRFIYWSASEGSINDDGEYTRNRVLVSFDLVTKGFKVVQLPDSLTNQQLYGRVSVSKLRDSLVVLGCINVDGAECGYDVWVMERDSSFTKLFRIGTPVNRILGFTRNTEPIIEVVKELGVDTHAGHRVSTVDVYDPCSQHRKSLGIDGRTGLFFMDSYKESLLLLNHSDSHIYYYNK